MKKWLSVVAIVLLAFAAGCGKDNLAQAVNRDAEPKTSPAVSAALPALNKIATSEKIAFSIKIPSEWDFTIWFDDMDNDYYLVIDGISIYMSVRQNIDLSISAESGSAGNYQYSSDEDFIFADGGKGFCRKSDVHTVFVNVSENGTLTYFINYGAYEGGAEWYNKNEVLIYEVAKTLTFTGTLAISGFGDYAIYVLPAFEYTEDGAIRIVAPRADLQSPFLKDNKMVIYPVKEGSPVSEPGEEYRKHDGVTIRSEFAHYTIGENTFEVQFMFPAAAIEDGLVMMRAMANSMRPVE